MARRWTCSRPGITGHPGGLATIHANSAAEALTRLEDLIGEVTQRVPHRAIAQAVNLVVFIERTPTGRRIRSVSRVTGWDGERYQLAAVDEPPASGGSSSS